MPLYHRRHSHPSTSRQKCPFQSIPTHRRQSKHMRCDFSQSLESHIVSISLYHLSLRMPSLHTNTISLSTIIISLRLSSHFPITSIYLFQYGRVMHTPHASSYYPIFNTNTSIYYIMLKLHIWAPSVRTFCSAQLSEGFACRVPKRGLSSP